ncbi:GGDEF domain-containing protein [Crassaminicella indica]|uniref:Diguanylate cyclase n=1 Tax=Crassaminicella indica TaxID=2855394 RepID=A0ABX8RCU7_9CLOT|nr:diguanylate cyclase [Crassaminicella indica]QXM06843.1 diguanylate cyclase [Crassaminicella indica]
MLDIKNSRMKILEELYLGIQLIILLFGILTSHIFTTSDSYFHIKAFLLIYGLYLLVLLIYFIRKTYFQNVYTFHPNLYLSFIDGIFLTIFLYLSNDIFHPVFHLFYIYITLQTIRFDHKSSSLFSSFITICYTIVTIMRHPKDIISLEFIMNVFSFYLLSYILSSVMKEIYRLETQIYFMLEEIKKKNAVLKEISSKDYLTNMYNHKSFYKYLKDVIEASEKKNTPFCLTIMDIDNFKKVNDTYGHLVGDAILKEISSIIHDHIRKTDIGARYGGEEFAIIFPNASIEEAKKICERIRKAIENHTFDVNNQKIKITISGGIGSAIIKPSSSNQHNFVAFVDNLLYEAKRLGKNQLQCSKEIIYLDSY